MNSFMVLVSALLQSYLKDDVLAKCLLLVTLKEQKTEQPSMLNSGTKGHASGKPKGTQVNINLASRGIGA